MQLIDFITLVCPLQVHNNMSMRHTRAATRIQSKARSNAAKARARRMRETAAATRIHHLQLAEGKVFASACPPSIAAESTSPREPSQKVDMIEPVDALDGEMNTPYGKLPPLEMRTQRHSPECALNIDEIADEIYSNEMCLPSLKPPSRSSSPVNL
eukprot:SAG11_NODE_933_length_6488_cov_18.190014_3_plen_156_part_00